MNYPKKRKWEQTLSGADQRFGFKEGSSIISTHRATHKNPYPWKWTKTFQKHFKTIANRNVLEVEPSGLYETQWNNIRSRPQQIKHLIWSQIVKCFPKKIETFLRGEENTFSMAVTQPWWKIDIAAINKRGQKEFTSGPDQHHLQYQSLNCWIADEISFLFDWLLPPVSPDDILTKTLFDFKSFDCKQSQQHNPKALEAKNKPRAQWWYRQRQRHWRWYYTENSENAH